VNSHAPAWPDGDVSVRRFCQTYPVSPPAVASLSSFRSSKNGSLGIHRYLWWATALSAQPLTHSSFSTCSQGTSFAVFDRSESPLLSTYRTVVLARPSVSPIEAARSMNHTTPLLPRHDGSSITVPSYLLALSDEVAPSIIVAPLCPKFFLLDPLPFSLLHTHALHSQQFTTFTLTQYTRSLYTKCATSKQEPIRIRF